MRKFISWIAALLMVVSFAACGSQKAQPAVPEDPERASAVQASEQTTAEMQPAAVSSAAAVHILVAYFSQAGEQYDVGVVEKGNTQIVAEMIAEETGAELFHIERAETYPDTYDELTQAAKEELGTRPELSETVDHWSDYNIVFIGYPIWWGDMPMPVYTFLEYYDFTGKTVIPFDTNGGSGLADTVSAIKKACPGATVRDGLAVSGKEAQTEPDKAKSEVQDWLKELGY